MIGMIPQSILKRIANEQTNADKRGIIIRMFFAPFLNLTTSITKLQNVS